MTRTVAAALSLLVCTAAISARSQSQAYPGTQHTYWVYVPAQYDPAKPTALMVFQDGQAFMNPNGDMRTPTVLDNLIFRREIPVMLAVFINPGRRPAGRAGRHAVEGLPTPGTGQVAPVPGPGAHTNR